jgi:ribosome-associated toxin RatA of RatAB toxin-antitoxin module
MKPQFKKGQWIIARWEESGDYDFAKFESQTVKTSFQSLLFYRFNGDWTFEDLSKFREDVDYKDSRYEFNWRLATKDEIKKFKKVAKVLMAAGCYRKNNGA